MRYRLHVLALLVLSTAGCHQTAPLPPIDTVLAEAHRLDLDGQQDEAIGRYEEVLRRDPQSYAAHYGLGRALDLAGRYNAARRHFATAIALASDSDTDQALRMMAIAWVFVGNVDEAASRYRQVFDRHMAAGRFSDASDVANELGRLYLEFGQLDHAETWYRTGHEAAVRQADRQPWPVDLADMRWAHAQARIAARRGQVRDARRLTTVVRTLLDKGGNKEQEIQYPYLVGYVDFYRGGRGRDCRLRQGEPARIRSSCCSGPRPTNICGRPTRRAPTMSASSRRPPTRSTTPSPAPSSRQKLHQP